MPRVFAGLAAAAVLLLIGTAALGLVGQDTLRDRHIVLAVLTLLLSCLIQVVVFTYLTVTGKMVSQAVHLGRLDKDLLREVAELKRAMTRQLALVVAAVVLATATGARRWSLGEGTGVHLVVGLAVLGVHIVVFYREYRIVVANSSLVERALASYGARRAGERG